MKSLQIIIKSPDDGDPLNCLAEPKEPNENVMTVGYKFRHTDGQWYGEHITIAFCSMTEETLMIAIGLLMRQASSTERRLLEDERHRNVQQVRRADRVAADAKGQVDAGGRRAEAL